MQEAIKLLTVDDLTEMLKVHRRTIYRYIKDGKIKGKKIGKAYYFTVDEYNAFVSADTAEK